MVGGSEGSGGGHRWVPVKVQVGTWAVQHIHKQSGGSDGMTKGVDVAKLFIAGLRTRTRAECEDWQKDPARLENKMAGEIQCR